MRWLPNFTSTYCGVNVHLALCHNNVLNVKTVVAAFNLEKALVRGLLRHYEPSDGPFSSSRIHTNRQIGIFQSYKLKVTLSLESKVLKLLYLYKCANFYIYKLLSWMDNLQGNFHILSLRAKSPISVKLTHFSCSQNSSFNYFILL